MQKYATQPQYNAQNFKVNNSVILYSTTQHQSSTIIHSHSITKDLSIIHHVDIIMGKKEASKEDSMEEEALEEVED
jgi:hypothetical protein